MGSISSAIGSSNTSSSLVTYFNGLSSNAQDLNNSISRAVQMASLPIELLQNNANDLTNQSNELQKLNSDLQAIRSAVSGLATAASNTLSASISSPSVASLTASPGALPGTYSLAVTNMGSYSDALSLDGLPLVTDPGSQSISSSASYTLTVNGTVIEPPITPASNTLNDLAKTINAADAGVQVTVVNVGSDTAPDYRLSLQSDQFGDVSMQLNDGGADLLAPTGPPGQPVQYTLNGRQIQSGSRTVTLATGLTANLTGATTGVPATITVGNNSTGVGQALQNLVSAYNTAISELNANRGTAGGALAGQSIVYQLTNSLRGLVNYVGADGQIPSLFALGASFSDTTAQLSFDQSAFQAATANNSDALAAFLGSASGGGFLQAANAALTTLLDPSTGVLTGDINTVKSSLSRTNRQITDQQAQVAQLQQNLTQQMSAADAMIYSLQQQATFFQQMFAAQHAAETAGLI